MSLLDAALSTGTSGGRRLRLASLDTVRVTQAMALLVVLAQLADVLTTNDVLKTHIGASEANPATRLVMIYLGEVWWLPKATLATFIAYAAVKLRSSSHCLVGVAAAVVGVYALAVLNNLLNL